MKRQSKRRGFGGERGFTLVELMIAVTIALFLSAGLLTLVQAMKAGASTQNGLSQLQDNERMAMTLIADVIQQAGYFPNPIVNQAATEFPVSVTPINFASQTSSFTYAGQALVGAGTFSNPPTTVSNSITVRYATAGTTVGPPPAPALPDNIINCSGNPSATPTTFTNTFGLVADPQVPGTYDLACLLQDSANPANDVTISLVGGVTQLQILYGVQSNPSVSNGSADCYLDAATVTASGYWPKVVSAKVTLWFVNPLYGTLAGQNQNPDTPPTIAFTRVVDVMNKTNSTP
jgi:type IV pilus assembly protein PilW